MFLGSLDLVDTSELDFDARGLFEGDDCSCKLHGKLFWIEDLSPSACGLLLNGLAQECLSTDDISDLDVGVFPDFSIRELKIEPSP